MRRTTFRRLCLVLLVGVVAVAASPVAAAPGAHSTASTTAFITASQYSPDSQECAMLSQINAYRKANGKASLRLSRTLGAAAEHHSRDMAAHNYFGHTLYNGTTWIQNIANHGYPSSNTYRGENIAAGYSSAASTFNQWKNSSGHRANMLNGTFKAIGIGRAYNSSARYRWYWTTTFGSVVDSTISC
jgi:uncharacterized protein YkwD